MEKIPEGSAVIFVFGEIDCREGILVAVEKMRYASVEEGMEHTVGIFVEVGVVSAAAPPSCKGLPGRYERAL